MIARLRRLQTPRTATALLVVVVVVIVAWVGVAVYRVTGVSSESAPDLAFVLQVGLPFPIVGWIISRRAPENALAWVFLVGPLLMLSSFIPIDIIGLVDPVTVAASRGAAMSWFLAEALFFIGVSLITSQFLVRFPSGRPPSRRWRIVTVGGAVGVVVTFVWSLARPCVMIASADLPSGVVAPPCSAPGNAFFTRLGNPFGLDRVLGGAVDLVGAIGLGLVVLALLAGAVSLFVRYRGAGSTERAQLRWLLAAVAILAPVFTGIALVELVLGRPVEGPIGQIVIGAALVFFPISIGIAITRYRLYDIDRFISRSVTYVVVVVVSAGVFALLALVPTLLLGDANGGDTPAWLVAVSTLAVAALFSPLQRRVQRLVDRRFDRARYDAGRVAERFSERVRDETDLDTIMADLGGVVAGIFRPRTVGLWMGS